MEQHKIGKYSYSDLYWHCRARIKPTSTSCYEYVVNDMNFMDLIEQIVEPWCENRPFAIYGKIINNRDQIHDIQIVQTGASLKNMYSYYEQACKKRGIQVEITDPKQIPFNPSSISIIWDTCNIAFGDYTQKLLVCKENDETTKTDFLSDFWNLIHPEISKVTKKLFEDSHYAESVEAAFKEINSKVKRIYKSITGEESDGQDLMFQAFGFKEDKGKIITPPKILIDDLSTESGKNIQEGYKFLFGGSIRAIRNPKAHENTIIDKKEAIHKLFLASLLMYKIDQKP